MSRRIKRKTAAVNAPNLVSNLIGCGIKKAATTSATDAETCSNKVEVMKARVYFTRDQYEHEDKEEIIEFSSIDELMSMYPGESIMIHDKYPDGAYAIEVYNAYRE